MGRSRQGRERNLRDLPPFKGGVQPRDLFAVQRSEEPVERYATLAQLTNYLNEQFDLGAHTHSEYTEKATLAAKGSIYGASAAGVPAERTVGANGFVLTADAAEATGLKWAAGGGGGGALTRDNLTPNETETGTSWTLAGAPVGNILLFLNGEFLFEVGTNATDDEFEISGTAVTTSYALVAGDRLTAWYASAAAWTRDDLTPLETETGTSWTLANTPVGDILLYLNGEFLFQVASAATDDEFQISGTSVTTSYALVAGDRLSAFYNK